MTMQNYTPISMPSLGKIFDMMKNLPPQQAAQDINSPDPAKKLAAMMVANSDKQLQQQQAAQQQPMPTVAQKLSQGMTQAPTAPTTPMPAVPPQAQAKPGAQGIAALQPQQMAPGSAMGILPTQVAPQTQGAPEPVQKASGGIASFASGGQAQQNQQVQRAQQLAQLMQAINQNSVAAVPQQAQQAGVAAPQQGQAMPMQNYASMAFATRPQYRPGTEAAPISQDLSLSQLGQYSSQQPIAAAHGGLMHHVPEHMYHFKEGGILGFDGKSGSKVTLSPADLDAQLNAITADPGIVPGNTLADARARAVPQPAPSAGSTSPVVQPAPVAQPAPVVQQAPASPPPGTNIDPAAINAQLNAVTADPGIVPGNTLANARAAAANTYTPMSLPQLDTGVAPHVRGNVPSPFQGIYDSIGNFFSNAPASTNPRLGGTRTAPAANAPSADAQANAASLLNNRNALMNGQSNIPTPAAAPAAAQTTTAPNPFTTAGGITEALPKNEEKRHEERRREKAKEAAPLVAAAPEDKKTGIAAALVPPSNDVTRLANEAMMAGLKVDDAKKRIQDLAEGRKALGISDEAGDSLAEQAKHFDEEYKRQDKSMEHFLKVLNGIAKGGLAGGGVEEENFVTAQRLSDQAHAEKYHDMIRQAKDKTRGEKMTDLNNITAAIDADKGKAATLGGNIYNTNSQAQTARDVERMRAQSAMDAAQLNSSTQYAIAKLSRDAALANKEVTANDIALELKNDPKYKGMSYADRMSAAFNIKSGLGEKLGVQGYTQMANKAMDFMKANAYNTDTDEYRAAAANYTYYTKKLKDLESKMAGESQESTAQLAMPSGAKLKAYADTHFKGDQAAAQKYLAEQGYK